MAKRGQNRRSDWHQTARLMRMRGRTTRDIAIEVGHDIRTVEAVCHGIKPKDVTGTVKSALLENYGIRVHQIERQSWPSTGGQPYPVKISLPFISILGVAEI